MGNDTAALVVALSAQLTKFESDMKSAVDIADKRTREIETVFTRMNGEINSKLQLLSSSAIGNIGFVGSLLSALGPAGFAAAAGIGVVVGGVLVLADATGKYAEKARLLKDAAETAGLTIAQFKLLGEAGKNVGLSFDETAAFVTHFLTNLAALRNGSGPLYDALLKVDVGLLRQLSVTRDSAQAVDLLVAAYDRLTDSTARLELSRAAGGRGGASGGRLLGFIGSQGGLAGIQANAPAFDQSQVERAAQLKIEIDEIGRKTQNIWGGMFSDTILANQKQARLEWMQISEWISKIVSDTRSGIVGDDFNARFIGDKSGPGLTARSPTQLTVTPPKGAASPSVDLAILQKNLSLLGEAVTQGEEWRKKKLEIAAAAEKGGLMDGIAQRALAAFVLTQRAAALATRERLGVATEQEIVDVKLAQLQQDKIKFGLKENEVQTATVVIMREAKQAADALAVRQAYLPGLKQLEIDARSLRKGLDDVTTSGLNTLTDGLADIVTHTKTVSDAFRDMANSIIRDLARMVIRQSITGPLAGALQGGLGSLFGGGVPATSPVTAPNFNIGDLSYLGIGKNASGTDNWRGGPTWVGENGPEIINLPRGAQVVPNDVSRQLGGGDTHVSVPISIDARGAQAGVADQITAAMRQIQASIVPTVRDAVRRRAL